MSGSDDPERTNRFDVIPLCEEHHECLWRLLDASASEWNEINYERQARYFGRKDGSVWDADSGAIEGRYKNVVGSAAAQQMIRKNSFAWRAFFNDEKPNTGVPGFWGNKEDGRKLHTVIRKDQYTIQWGEDHSRLEIPVGRELKDEYGLSGRLRLEIRGEAKWSGEQCQLELKYDEDTDTFRAFQTVKPREADLSPPLATADDQSADAALDVGSNNLVACTTTTDAQYLYDGQRPFEQFIETTREIDRLKAKLPPGIYSSKRIRELYRTRTEQRNHAQDTLVRQLVDDLYHEGVGTVYVGDLTNVLDAHWKPRVNAKTHNFWAPRRFVDRLGDVCEEYQLELVEESEAWTSQECPACGEREATIRHEDSLVCPACGFEGHADLQASATFLARNSEMIETAVRSMARPVRFQWDDYSWSELSCPRESPIEQRTNPVRSQRGAEVASGRG